MFIAGGRGCPSEEKSFVTKRERKASECDKRRRMTDKGKRKARKWAETSCKAEKKKRPATVISFREKNILVVLQLSLLSFHFRRACCLAFLSPFPSLYINLKA